MADTRLDLTRLTRQNSDYFTGSRPRLTSIQSPPESPSSPRTPGRPFLFNRQSSSNFNSPGVTFRVDDEILVFEFNSTFIQAGLGGEEKPRSIQNFGPAQQTRAGDYSAWLPNAPYSKRRKIERMEDWGKDRELWQMDLRGVDMGLVQDKIERAVRTAIRDYLLVQDETKRRSFTIAMPPLLPQPLLASLLQALFHQCPSPVSITLLSTPTLSTISAGLRSSLVVDIGWQETVVTAIYDYREVQHRRSSRGVKHLSWETRKMLLAELSRILQTPAVSDSDLSFEDVEEVLGRMVWTRKREQSDSREQQGESTDDLQREISITLASFNVGKPVPIPFKRFSDPVEASLIASNDGSDAFDDEDLPLPSLVYQSLRSLPVDARGVCEQRLLIVGSGAKIPGLKNRILEEVSSIIHAQDWDPVRKYGSRGAPPRRHRSESRSQSTDPSTQLLPEDANKDMNPDSNVPAHLQPQLPDTVISKIQQRAQSTASRPTTKESSPQQASKRPVRSLRSLGAWAGASMVAGLRIRGLVEIERERFLQYGLTGGDDKKRQSAPPPSNAVPSRPTISTPGPGMGKAERNSWSLGIWA